MRIALGVEYNGNHYAGWQRQSHDDNTVQQALETAISFVANHPVKTYCAGRTDRGVHGVSQVVHFDTTALRDERAWRLGINTKLPNTIRLHWVHFVDDSFHARFQATYRRYCYVLYENEQKSALLDGLVGFYRGQLEQSLNVAKMHEAAQLLVGEKDFSSFRAANCQAKHAIRQLQKVAVTREKKFIVIDIQANSFLYHMVRNIVGSLIVVGEGKRSVAWFADLITAKNRQLAPAMAAASGLYLVEIGYNACYNLPKIPANFLFKEL